MNKSDNELNLEDVYVRVKNFQYDLKDILDQVKILARENSELVAQVKALSNMVAKHECKIAELNRKPSVPTTKYNSEIELCNVAIILNPNNHRAYFNRGLAYYHQQQYERAVVDYNKAIELQSDYAAAYFYRGVAYERLDVDWRAQADFAKAKEFGYKD